MSRWHVPCRKLIGRYARCQDFARALAGETPAQASSNPAGHRPHLPRLPCPPKLYRPGLQEPRGASSSLSASRQWWIGLAAGVATVALASVVALMWHPWSRSQSATTPTTPTPSGPVSAPTMSSAAAPPTAAPTFAATAADNVLLGPSEVMSVTGATGPPLQANSSMSGYGEMKQVKPSSCSAIMMGADHGGDPNAGLVAARGQTMTRSPTSTGDGPKEVEQSVSVFTTAEEARAALTSLESSGDRARRRE